MRLDCARRSSSLRPIRRSSGSWETLHAPTSSAGSMPIASSLTSTACTGTCSPSGGAHDIVPAPRREAKRCGRIGGDPVTMSATGSAVFLAATLAAAALTPLARIAGRRAGAVARPADDRWSRREIPLLGGAAIWMATLLVALAWEATSKHAFVALFIGTAFFALGLMDDFVRLRPGAKLAAQA